eukprot:g48479.t1
MESISGLIDHWLPSSRTLQDSSWQREWQAASALPSQRLLLAQCPHSSLLKPCTALITKLKDSSGLPCTAWITDYHARGLSTIAQGFSSIGLCLKPRREREPITVDCSMLSIFSSSAMHGIDHRLASSMTLHDWSLPEAVARALAAGAGVGPSEPRTVDCSMFSTFSS